MGAVANECTSVAQMFYLPSSRQACSFKEQAVKQHDAATLAARGGAKGKSGPSAEMEVEVRNNFKQKKLVKNYSAVPVVLSVTNPIFSTHT